MGQEGTSLPPSLPPSPGDGHSQVSAVRCGVVWLRSTHSATTPSLYPIIIPTERPPAGLKWVRPHPDWNSQQQEVVSEKNSKKKESSFAALRTWQGLHTISLTKSSNLPSNVCQHCRKRSSIHLQDIWVNAPCSVSVVLKESVGWSVCMWKQHSIASPSTVDHWFGALRMPVAKWDGNIKQRLMGFPSLYRKQPIWWTCCELLSCRTIWKVSPWRRASAPTGRTPRKPTTLSG